MHVLELVDAVACGDDVRKGKPHPDLYYSGLKKIGLKKADQAMCVGDSPFDAMAARLLGLRAAGVLTGGFTSAALARAGCNPIFRDVSELEDIGSSNHDSSGALPSGGVKLHTGGHHVNHTAIGGSPLRPIWSPISPRGQSGAPPSATITVT
jgi:hypothetical protein